MKIIEYAKMKKILGVGGSGGAILVEKTVTDNGEYPASNDGADGYSKVTVAVEGEGGTAIPVQVPTEAEMTALLESGEVGGVYKYTGTSGTYENGALYVLEEGE